MPLNQSHPTYRALNRTLTLCGCERRLFLCAMFIGLGMFLTFKSIIAGLMVFLCFAVLGYFSAKDPTTLRLLFNASRYRNQYDPGIRRPFPVVYDHSR